MIALPRGIPALSATLLCIALLGTTACSAEDTPLQQTGNQDENSTVPPGLGSPVVHELSDNVLAITGLYHSSGPQAGVAAGIVFTENTVVFIDSGMSIASAEFMWELASERMMGNEDLYLILTHGHSDHVFGMKVFVDKGATVIGHKDLKGFILEHAPDYKDFIINMEGWTQEQGDEILGDVVLTPPDQLIDEDTVLNIDGTELHILFTPGHVPHEISVYVPSTKTLFAGDTIYEGMRLNTRFGGPEDWKLWISHLERFKKLDIETIIPGHGDICAKDEIDRNIDYLKKLL